MVRLVRMLPRLAALSALVAGTLGTAAHAGVVINYGGFSGSDCGTGLNCVGNTAVAGNALRLTSATSGQAGAGYSNTAIALGSNSTFSTSFQFRITNTGGIDPADGLTFVVAKNAQGLGGAGGGIGYGGVGNSLAIEFDTYRNSEFGDPNSNHVGVDINGSLTSAVTGTPYGQASCVNGNNTRFGCMSNGDIWTAFISYDGATNLLGVSLQDSNGALENLISSTAFDLSQILNSPTAFVGFTSGTGSGWGNHDILNWQFANDTSVTPGDPTLPEPSSLALVGLAMAGLGWVGRRTRAAR